MGHGTIQRYVTLHNHFNRTIGLSFRTTEQNRHYSCKVKWSLKMFTYENKDSIKIGGWTVRQLCKFKQLQWAYNIDINEVRNYILFAISNTLYTTKTTTYKWIQNCYVRTYIRPQCFSIQHVKHFSSISAWQPTWWQDSTSELCTLMVLSPEAETMYLSSKSTTLTAALCPTRTRRRTMSFGDLMSHTAMVRSYVEEGSGVKEIDRSGSNGGTTLLTFS